MNSVAEALNTLISGVNVAHSKGVYTLEESHYLYLAISYLNSLSQQEAPQQAAPQSAPAPVQESVVEVPEVEGTHPAPEQAPQGY